MSVVVLVALLGLLAVVLFAHRRAVRGAWTHDAELGLLNRAGLERELARGEHAAVAVISLEGLAQVTAVGGTPAAAVFAREAAGRLAAAGGPLTVLGRVARDRLVALVPAEHTVDVLLATLNAPVDVDGTAHPVRPVTGVAIAEPDALTHAEVALHSGDGAVRLYSPDLQRAAVRRATTLAEFESALESGQLHLHFQPILDLATGRVESVEALLRWDHPQRGRIAPADFLPLIEETGLMDSLTAHVLSTALDHCASWRGAGVDLTVAVNLSARNVTDPDLPTRVRHELTRRQLPPSALKLEITESVLMDRPTVAAQTLGELQALGVALALDDFGTGYSSLAYLQRLPLDELKIDRSFVRALSDPRAAAVVRAIVAMAAELGLRTVAEGVEDEDALEQVRALGCTYAQGFHVARPLAPPGLRLWLSRRDGEMAAAPPSAFV